MSPFDVWNGTLSNGPGDVPNFSTSDKTCTVPAIPAGGQLFQGNGANGTPCLHRRRPPMAVRPPPTGCAKAMSSVIMMGTSPATGLAANAVHTAAGVPANCAALRSAFALQGGTTIASAPSRVPQLRRQSVERRFQLGQCDKRLERQWSGGHAGEFLHSPPDHRAVTAQSGG